MESDTGSTRLAGAEALAQRPIGDIVSADWRSAAVFEKHGIDFCCGGSQTLGAACSAKGLEPEAILHELSQALAAPAEGVPDYVTWKSSDLADHIIRTHHAWLAENTSLITTWTAKIASVHGTRHPELVRIAAIFAGIAADLTGHLAAEEEVFFPAIKRLEAARNSQRAPLSADLSAVRSSLASLGAEHEKIGDAVHEIRRLAANFALPPDACATYTLSYKKLAEFEEELHKHVHLENNILFPKAAGL